MEFEIVIRVKTQQIIIEKSEDEDELPLRKWMVEICMLDKDGKEVPADILESCTYYLHKTFEHPVRKIAESPFTLTEQGWGEFDMKIVCKLIGKSGKFTIIHDIEFQDDAYAIDYTVQVPVINSKMRSTLLKNFNVPDEIDAPVNKPQEKWGTILQDFDEDMITEFTQIILNNRAVKAEINRHDPTERVHLHFGQFPVDLLEQLIDYIKEIKSGTETKTVVNEGCEEEIDIFGDLKGS